jgi:hypothetical protein
MAEVVFLARADGAVGQKHERAVAHESAHGVVRVDPRVAAGGRVELGARRPQFDGRDRRLRAERAHKRSFVA